LNLDFSGASTFTVHLGGWPARLAICASILLGPARTLWFCRRLPALSIDLGLLCVPASDIFRVGQWALVRHIGGWYSFMVLRANSDAQLLALEHGSLSYRL
jgi:hypothetical protein